jgi:hypothetical protein
VDVFLLQVHQGIFILFLMLFHNNFLFQKKKPKPTAKATKASNKKASTPAADEVDPKTAEEIDQAKLSPGAQKKKRIPLKPPLPPATNFPLIPDEKSTISEF